MLELCTLEWANNAERRVAGEWRMERSGSINAYKESHRRENAHASHRHGHIKKIRGELLNTQNVIEFEANSVVSHSHSHSHSYSYNAS